MQHERGNALIIILGVVLVIFLIGFFNGSRGLLDTFGFKYLLHLPCGITVEQPEKDTKLTFPTETYGYINGCGWQPSGRRAGQVQVFDATGIPVTASTSMTIPPESLSTPFSFDVSFPLVAPPHTDTGSMLFTSTTGLLYSVPVKF